MALRNSPAVDVGTSATDIYTCPTGLEGSTHHLLIYNRDTVARTVTVRLHDASAGSATEIVTAFSIAAGAIWSSPVAINLEAGDKVQAIASATGALRATAAVFLDTPASVVTAFTPRGTYNAGSSYVPGDVLEHFGHLVSPTSNVTGTAPFANAAAADADPPTTTAPFVLMLRRGSVADGSVTFVKLASAALATVSEWLSNATSKVLSVRTIWDAAAPVALTDAATIAVDLNTGVNFTVTLGGNRTLGNPTNTKPGQSGVIRVAQDGTGGRTLAFGSNWRPGSPAFSIGTAANRVNFLSYYVHSATEIEVFLGRDRAP